MARALHGTVERKRILPVWKRDPLPLCRWKHIVAQTRFPAVISTIDPKPGEVIVDFGCAHGQYVHEFRSRGAMAFGLDISFSDAEPYIPQVQANVYSAPIKSGSVDKAFASELLNGLENPARALQEMRRTLKPGGILILCVGRGYKIFESVLSTGATKSPMIRWCFKRATGVRTDQDLLALRTRMLKHYAVHEVRGRYLNESDVADLLKEAGFSGPPKIVYAFKHRVTAILGFISLFQLGVGLTRWPKILGWRFWWLFPLFKRLEANDRKPGGGVIYIVEK
ncbi:MAG: class I SAM-dependent methyltransferase [Rhodospirillales bacterium]|nr:class I SAM-dependent methyltransferase [Rhodospirillales bacterium]